LKENVKISKFKEKCEKIDNLELLFVNKEDEEKKEFKNMNKLLQNYIKGQLMNSYLKFGEEISLSIRGKRTLFKTQNINNNNWFEITPETIIEIKFEEKIKKINYKIGGLDDEYQKILKILPFENIELYKKHNIPTIKGILVYGISGTGKTTLIKYFSQNTPYQFFEIRIIDLLSNDYIDIFEKTIKLASKSPSIIFIDDIDLISKNKKILYHIQSIFDDLNENIIFISCTNEILKVDDSLKRPGRFDYELEIPIPSQIQRFEIIKILLNNFSINHNLDENDIKKVSEITHGFVGSDLKILINESLSQENNLTLIDLLNKKNDIKPSAIKEIILSIPKVYWDGILFLFLF
jgi:SpoVK/Ycf46/Vps4 family AAA+-type ATPase